MTEVFALFVFLFLQILLPKMFPSRTQLWLTLACDTHSSCSSFWSTSFFVVTVSIRCCCSWLPKGPASPRTVPFLNDPDLHQLHLLKCNQEMENEGESVFRGKGAESDGHRPHAQVAQTSPLSLRIRVKLHTCMHGDTKVLCGRFLSLTYFWVTDPSKPLWCWPREVLRWDWLIWLVWAQIPYF